MIWKIILLFGICFVAGILGALLTAFFDAWIKKLEEDADRKE